VATIQLFAPPPPAPWDNESSGFMHADLARSGLVPLDMGAYPIASTKYSAAAYCIPYKDNDNLWRCRIARERDKYISTTNSKPDIWIPPQTELARLYEGDLFIVEGEKKAAAVYKYWDVASVVGIGGCWNAVTKNEKNEQYRLIEKLQILITPGRRVHLILDGDVIDNKNVGRAALTLNNCIEALNGSMQLYRPPTEWKGVDDWIFQDPKACFEHLELVPFDKLAINRTLLYTQLDCSVGSNGSLILNELNASKLIAYHFKSLGVVQDKRLGFIDKDRSIISMASLHTKALHYLQGDISPRYPASAINGGFSDLTSSGINIVDLVQDFVKSRLVWDGVARLETWGSEYFQSDMPKLANEWGRILLTSLVMRILEPGCKVDTVCILNGPQGIGKTTFFEQLAVLDDYHFYRAISDLPGSNGGDDRTFKQTIVSSLVVDLSEGIIFESRKTSSDRLKQFITEQFDEYRVAYAKNNTITPRGYIFVGTTNRPDQLTDRTGSRRWLYLNVSKIKRLEYEVKLQLLAEVVARFDAIKATNWYDLHLEMSDMPEELRNEHQHITNPNELLNIQHYRSDYLTDAIQHYLDIDDVSYLRTGEAVITAAFVAAKLGKSGDGRYIDQISRKFSELNVSPTFPYTFERVRKRGGQMDFKQGHKEQYIGLITNDQVMFTCFIVKRK
jgi:hypothetical protein